MSLTGEPEGEPVKVGIGNADLVTGQGQHVDIALLDGQLALMTSEAENDRLSDQEKQNHEADSPLAFLAVRAGGQPQIAGQGASARRRRHHP